MSKWFLVRTEVTDPTRAPKASTADRTPGPDSPKKKCPSFFRSSTLMFLMHAFSIYAKTGIAVYLEMRKLH